MKAAFGQDGQALEQVRADWEEHKRDIDEFKQLEKYWKQRARNSPGEVAVFMFDDTECIGFPHFGRRIPKAWGDKRHNLNVSRRDGILVVKRILLVIIQLVVL